MVTTVIHVPELPNLQPARKQIGLENSARPCGQSVLAERTSRPLTGSILRFRSSEWTICWLLLAKENRSTLLKGVNSLPFFSSGLWVLGFGYMV
jgi:hypothetical protein